MKNHFSMALALFVALAALCASAYEKELLSIGFESGEGYELGSVIDQNGWTHKDPGTTRIPARTRSRTA